MSAPTSSSGLYAKEGKVQVVKGDAFLNTTHALERDATVLLVQAALDNYSGPELEDYKVLDAFAGSGIRSIRLIRELKTPNGCRVNVVLAEKEESARDIIKQNLRINKVFKSQAELKLDAKEALLEHPGIYDYVDIDPFGSCWDSIADSLVAVKDGGLIGYSSFDVNHLYAKSEDHRGACFRKYGGYPMKSVCREEAGIRLLLACIHNHAVKLGLVIEPLLCFAQDFVVSAFVRVKKGTPAENANRRLFFCQQNCLAYEFNDSEEAIACSSCGHAGQTECGPLWVGPLYEKATIQYMHNAIENDKNCTLSLSGKRRFRTLLQQILVTCDSPLFVSVKSELEVLQSQGIKVPDVHLSKVHAALLRGLREEGYVATTAPTVTDTSHFLVKSSASIVKLRECLRNLLVRSQVSGALQRSKENPDHVEVEVGTGPCGDHCGKDVDEDPGASIKTQTRAWFSKFSSPEDGWQVLEVNPEGHPDIGAYLGHVEQRLHDMNIVLVLNPGTYQCSTLPKRKKWLIMTAADHGDPEFCNAPMDYLVACSNAVSSTQIEFASALNINDQTLAFVGIQLKATSSRPNDRQLLSIFGSTTCLLVDSSVQPIPGQTCTAVGDHAVLYAYNTTFQGSRTQKGAGRSKAQGHSKAWNGPSPQPPHNQRGLFVAGSARGVMLNCTVLNPGGPGVEVRNAGHIVMMDSKIDGAGRAGLFGQNDAQITLINVPITYSQWAGMEIQGAVELKMYGSTIANSARGGLLLLANSSAYLKKCTIQENRYSGINARNDTIATIRSSTIQASKVMPCITIEHQASITLQADVSLHSQGFIHPVMRHMDESDMASCAACPCVQGLARDSWNQDEDQAEESQETGGQVTGKRKRKEEEE